MWSYDGQDENTLLFFNKLGLRILHLGITIDLKIQYHKTAAIYPLGCLGGLVLVERWTTALINHARP